MSSSGSFRILVNGALLPQYIGKRVTIYGTVVKSNPKGYSFYMKTTDDRSVVVDMGKSFDEITGLVEVHGIVKDSSTITCNYYLVFPSEIAATYEPELTNDMVKILHSVPNTWANSLQD